MMLTRVRRRTVKRSETTDEGETKRRESEIDEDGAGERRERERERERKGKKRRRIHWPVGGEVQRAFVFQWNAPLRARRRNNERNGGPGAEPANEASFKIITNIEKRRSIFRQRVPIINELQRGETRVSSWKRERRGERMEEEMKGGDGWNDRGKEFLWFPPLQGRRG